MARDVIVTQHAQKRLKEHRQSGITINDIKRDVLKIPGNISLATRFRGFISTKGKIYDIVAKDILEGRLVITIIGKN